MSDLRGRISRDELGGSIETAILLDWDGDEDEDGEEAVPSVMMPAAIESKPNLEALNMLVTQSQPQSRSQPAVRPPGGEGRFVYLQPTTSIIPNITELPLYKTSVDTLIRRTQTCSEKREREARNLLKRLREPGATWGLIDELMPGRKGGCVSCIKKGYNCVVKLERNQGADIAGPPSKVVGRCIGCAVSTHSQRCDIVLEFRRVGDQQPKKTKSRPHTAAARASPRIPLCPPPQRASRAQTLSTSSAATPVVATSRLGVDDGGSGGNVLVPASGADSSGKRIGLKRKSTAYGAICVEDCEACVSSAMSNVTAKHARTGTTPTRIASSVQVIIPTPISVAPRPSTGAVITDSGDAEVKALAGIRSGVGSVRVELAKNVPSGLDGRMESLFTMMDVELAILDQIVSPSATSQNVDREEAKDAVEFVSDFAESTSMILAQHSEGGKLDFLSRTMFKVIKMHTDTLRRAAGRL